MVSDAITDRSTEIGHAGRYLQRFGRHPTEDDVDEFSDGVWPAAWEELQGIGAADDLEELYFESWRVAHYGPRA